MGGWLQLSISWPEKTEKGTELREYVDVQTQVSYFVYVED